VPSLSKHKKLRLDPEILPIIAYAAYVFRLQELASRGTLDPIVTTTSLTCIKIDKGWQLNLAATTTGKMSDTELILVVPMELGTMEIGLGGAQAQVLIIEFVLTLTADKSAAYALQYVIEVATSVLTP